ncbi:MAG: hypothetical protein ACI9J2_001354 [Saprospiraceae bacterium]|jgi:hypothetical protein
MKDLLRQTIKGPSVWKGSELSDDDSWIMTLSSQTIACIDSALEQAKAANIDYSKLSPSDFPLHALAGDLNQIAETLENGRGFLLLRGLPVNRYTDAEIEIIYYGIGLHLGLPVCQNPKGDLLGLVMNKSDITQKETRVYETNAYLPYHTDPSDVFGLLCLRNAQSGGLSSLVSVASVYNEIAENHPEYLALFYRPMYYAHLGEALPSLSPIFSFFDGKLTCRYLRQYIELGHEIMNLPLSNIEVEALDLLDSILHNPDLRLDMMLQPGDIQLANNYTVLHSRSAFEDAEPVDQRRKLLRLWLKMPNARKLSPEFPGRNGFPAPQQIELNS